MRKFQHPLAAVLALFYDLLHAIGRQWYTYHHTVNRECALHILSIIVISTFERQRAGMVEAPDAVI
jgi:hypothetical protein